VNRRALGVAVAVAIAAAAFQPFYLRIYTTNRAGLAAALTELPYRKLPGMRQFMLDVRARTRDGNTIAIVSPLPAQDAYEYLFTRGRYLLGGRMVVSAQNLATATHIACFHCTSAAPGFAEIWRGRDGALLRRAP
jgi:hypothetical protein